jgi:cell division protein FtsB
MQSGHSSGEGRQQKEPRLDLRWMLRSALHAIFFLGVVALLLAALAGDRGRFAVLELETQRSALLAEIRELEAENRQLELSLEQLRRPRFAAEKTARETFGLAREDERVFIDGPAPPPEPARSMPPIQPH